MLLEIIQGSLFHSTIELSIFVALFSVFLLVERKFPIETDHSMRHWFGNIAITGIYLFFGTFLMNLVSVYVDINFRTVEFDSIAVNFLIVIGSLFTGDFLFYWYHRIEHHSSVLWPIHELHHSEGELSATSGYRTYFLELPLQGILIGLPVTAIFGYTPIIIPYIYTFTIIWEFFTHSNIRLHLGRFTPILTGPQLHRIHHSSERRHWNKNFAQFFPVIDILFGTYHRPAPDEFPSTGTPHLASDASLAYILSKPFISWSRMIRRADVNGE